MKLMKFLQSQVPHDVAAAPSANGARFFFLWLIFGFASLAHASSNAIVGEVILVSGSQAVIVSDAGNQTKARRGLKVHAGDQILTSDEDYVHLRLSDEARLSLHPKSKLVISCYQTQPADERCMRLDLQYGKVHVIDGKAAKASSERFRLNTPIAAVGVRGTEFVTAASAQVSEVQVLEGEVVVAPLGEGCEAQALGVCQTPFAVPLTAEDPFLLQVVPHQKPKKVALDRHRLALRSERQTAKPVSLSVAEILMDNPALVARYRAQAVESMQQGQQSKPPSAPYPSFSNQTEASLPALIYSTWNNSKGVMSRPYSQVPDDYQVTVGDNQTVLWRQEGVYHPGSGEVHFDLDQSMAILNKEGNLSELAVSSGRLTLNFDTRHITTQLSVALPGAVTTYALDARLNRDDGVFALSNPQGARFSGAIANDGQSVGYYLNDVRPEGLLKVQTLWSARPAVAP